MRSMVVNGKSEQLTSGLEPARARQVAQNIANDYLETVRLVDPADPADEGEAFEPEMDAITDRISAAFDALAELDGDPLTTFCSGWVPAELGAVHADLLGRLTFIRGPHPGVSDDSPEVLVDSPWGRLVVGYDDYNGGNGIAGRYEPPEYDPTALTARLFGSGLPAGEWMAVVVDDNEVEVARGRVSRPGESSLEQEHVESWAGELQALLPPQILNAICDVLLVTADGDDAVAEAKVELS